jgi:hypothetical protein
MPLQTRLTTALGIEHPILLAPMDLVAGGKLAAAVSHAGGLGHIGGGYGNADWLEQEFAAASNAKVGCGFITWSLAKKPGLLHFRVPDTSSGQGCAWALHQRRAPYHLALDPFPRKEGFGRNDPWANGLPGGESQRGQ